ncbi:sugar ABC transporter ATP-binding protein [Aquincola sp. S2]|uniref:Sugar ABC transporter ATP-binding protein n=1 Tax=Pseudaquabacterium terrae TaxID=2732868 RepID=A0ABX2ER60_9BURK|nr:sugar ABC transporter ATP-binding protein [Aquabacterium terrae]NRF71146.1 sugar ABC transporter ATP-binding protein [Aquabacterium terrae]
MLRLSGITKRFVGVQALRDVQLHLRAGEVHALMGQNGAGKSTLIKVLTGVHPADDGEIRLAGEPIRPRSPAEAQGVGIATVYQEVNLCGNLSVAENIFAGRLPRRAGFIDRARMVREARELLRRLHLDIDVGQPLGRYPVAVQQMVAIARALGMHSRVLILDEPSSSLDADEVQHLFAVLRGLRAQGLAILFVTHFLDEVYALADRITVLRNGEFVGEYTPPELPAPALVAAMIGRELAAEGARQPAAASGGGAPLLETRGLARRGALQPADLQIRPGEVLGLAGLLGSGRTELARLLFGMDRPDRGELRVDGRVVSFEHPAQAVALGLAMCPEERKIDGIVADLSVRENIVLALQARQGLWKVLSRRRQQEIAERYIRALDIRTADADTPIGQLSGGNQQKAILARWLATEPRLLILDEPTRGIDVAAKQEIMNEIVRLARAGLAVLFVSSELDEIARLADRIAVLRERRLVGELPGGSDEATIGRLITGAVT